MLNQKNDRDLPWVRTWFENWRTGKWDLKLSDGRVHSIKPDQNEELIKRLKAHSVITTQDLGIPPVV